MKRKTPLRAKKPMTRRDPIKKKSSKRKSTASRWANDSYLAFVRNLPCSCCGLSPAGDAHHIIGVGNFSGVGLKAPDTLTMPLCRTCHGRVHSDHDTWHSQWQWVYDTLSAAIIHWAGSERHTEQLRPALEKVGKSLSYADVIKAIQDYHR